MHFEHFSFWKGKARRLKQAKDEATEEIEKYRQERDKQFKDFEAKVFRRDSPLLSHWQKTGLFNLFFSIFLFI